MEQVELKKLIDNVMDELRTFGLSDSTLKSYRYSGFSPVKNFFTKNERHFYSKETTMAFLTTMKGRLKNSEISERHYRKLRKAVNLLDEYFTTGTVVWKTRDKRSKIKVNEYFTSVFLAFEKSSIKRLMPGTVENLKTNTLQFLKFLEDEGNINFDKISNSEIKDFILYTSSNHRASMNNVLFSMKTLLNYLNENEIIDINAEQILQKAARPRKKVLPCFSHEEVKVILNQIDISTAKGKRDYTIIYLASHTGLRITDILNLKLTDIDWTKDEIHIIQRKTGNPLILPLETGAGNAIADYILTGRPNTDSPYVFIRTIAPYTNLSNKGSGRNILKKYMDSAEIVHLSGDGKGFHALRRSMGTWMLEADIPLSVISQVLGHRDQNSTKQYLSLHYSMLTECALNLQGIEAKKEELL